MCSIIGFADLEIPEEKFQEAFQRTKSRGPDMSRVMKTPAGILAFHRLSIMDVS